MLFDLIEQGGSKRGTRDKRFDDRRAFDGMERVVVAGELLGEVWIVEQRQAFHRGRVKKPHAQKSLADVAEIVGPGFNQRFERHLALRNFGFVVKGDAAHFIQRPAITKNDGQIADLLLNIRPG